MRHPGKLILSSYLLLTQLLPSAQACDLCAIYQAGEAHGEIGKGLYAGFAEQFTYFGSLRQDGHAVNNLAGQLLDSSITQPFVGYHLAEKLGLQFNAPVIYRYFKRIQEGRIEHGTEAGLGDASLTATYQLYGHDTMDSTVSLSLLGGAKLPTGDTGRLAEETHETPTLPGGIPSGIHGHNLTLGTGSYDGIIGASGSVRWKRAFLSAAIQYALRTRGDFDYRFADDLTWSGGPGVSALLADDYTLSVQASISGESKGRDTFRGELTEDTGITAVYVGPQLLATWRTKLAAQLGVDLPVILDNTAFQSVPDYRLRAALTWHF